MKNDRLEFGSFYKSGFHHITSDEVLFAGSSPFDRVLFIDRFFREKRTMKSGFSLHEKKTLGNVEGVAAQVGPSGEISKKTSGCYGGRNLAKQPPQPSWLQPNWGLILLRLFIIIFLCILFIRFFPPPLFGTFSVGEKRPPSVTVSVLGVGWFQNLRPNAFQKEGE